MSGIENVEYLDDEIRMHVPIDEVTHQKYLKEFEPQRFEKRRRGLPPPGWSGNE